MTDPAGYRKAATAIEDASEGERRMMAAQQASIDQLRVLANDLVQHAVPDPEDLRNLMLMNLTTAPSFHPRSIGLTWMQRLPEAWRGWYPEQCQQVAELLGMGEEVK